MKIQKSKTGNKKSIQNKKTEIQGRENLKRCGVEFGKIEDNSLAHVFSFKRFFLNTEIKD